ncbi:MAG: hypothetical protein ACKVPX_11270 [Myxococcaceae bacterium]
MRWLIVFLFLGAPFAMAVPSGKTQIQLDVKPENVVIYVDSKKVGKATRVRTLPVSPGRHRIRLVRDIVSHEETIVVKSGETKRWVFQLGDEGKKSDEVQLEPDSGAGGSGSEGAAETSEGQQSGLMDVDEALRQWALRGSE